MRVEQVVAGPMRLGEGIVWDSAAQRLCWVDILARKVFRCTADGGDLQAWDMPTEVGFCAPHVSGGLVVGLNDGFALLDTASGDLTPWRDPEPDRPGNRFNDAATDQNGRLWAGTMPLAGVGPKAEGALYRLDSPTTAHQVMSGFWIQNGMAFSADGATGYVSDSAPHVQTIWRFALDRDTGAPRDREVFLETRGLAGRPDGATVDADGCYWFAAVDGWQILRVTPGGVVDRHVPLPVRRPTKLAFGGPDLSTLFISTMGPEMSPETPAGEQPLAGSILALTPGVSGIAAPPVQAV